MDNGKAGGAPKFAKNQVPLLTVSYHNYKTKSAVFAKRWGENSGNIKTGSINVQVLFVCNSNCKVLDIQNVLATTGQRNCWYVTASK